MKKLVATIAALACASTLVHGQGTIVFITSALGTSAKVTEANSFPGAGAALGNTVAGVAGGTQFLAQLYVGAGSVANSASLVPVGAPVNFRNGTGNGGYVLESGNTTLGAAVNPDITIPNSILPTPGGAVTIQLRAWWAGAGGNQFTTYEAAYAAGQGGLATMRLGGSALVLLNSTGNPTSQPPGTPVGLTGLAGFQLAVVPEPSSFALAGLGMASLLIFRRRK
jgi:hypothetical protein